jgi:hypothetical protein
MYGNEFGENKEKAAPQPKPADAGAGPGGDPGTLSLEAYKSIADAKYPGITLFARDADLPPALAERYRPGMLLREKNAVDASIRFVGMVTTHRYVILSNHMTDMRAAGQGTDLGLFTSRKNARFKVLGQAVHEGKTGIFLLHLPDDETWRVYENTVFQLDGELFETAVRRFKAKCDAAPAPELITREWLTRCAFPLGMNEQELFWPLTDKAPWEQLGPEDLCQAKYYRLGENVLLKHTLDDRYFRLDPFDECWHEDQVIRAEFRHGEVCPYQEIPLEDRYLTVEDGSGQAEILLGRDEACGIRFRDKCVSRRHALLLREDGKWLIRDLDSLNGTFVNGERVKEKLLQPGDCIRMGAGSVIFKGTVIQIREGDTCWYRTLPAGG